MISANTLKGLRTHLYWLPLSKIWHSFHKYVYFNIFNKELNKNSNRKKSFPPYRIENPESKTIKLTSDLYKFIKKDTKIKKIKQELLSSNSITSYTTDIFPYLDIALKSKLFYFSISDKNIQTYLNNYFGFNPRLHDISILYNFYKEGLKEEGSKLWHRDSGDCDLRQVKVFIPITKINSKNGPFFFVKNRNLAKENIAIKGIKGPAWIGGRVSNQSIKNLKGEIHSTEGINSGSKIYFDSKRIYHKGGFSKGEDRLMIQFSYLTNAYCATKPQDFSKEINFLKRSKDTKITKIINNYIYYNNGFNNMNFLSRKIRYLFFRLGMIFTYYIDK